MDVVNPATGETVETYETDSSAEEEAKLDRATDAFETWRDRPLREREELLARAGEVLRENKHEYA